MVRTIKTPSQKVKITKAEFVRSLQEEVRVLHPYEVSQRLREAYGVVSVCQIDEDLSASEYRGYMIRGPIRDDRSPENPELYTCVVSADQSYGWQKIVWTKEILQILDAHRTSSRELLERSLEMRVALEPHDDDTPPHVIADKEGLLLALGVTMPLAFRNSQRSQVDSLIKRPRSQLEQLFSIPSELLRFVLSKEFEGRFNDALERERHKSD